MSPQRIKPSKMVQTLANTDGKYKKGEIVTIQGRRNKKYQIKLLNFNVKTKKWTATAPKFSYYNRETIDPNQIISKTNQ